MLRYPTHWTVKALVLAMALSACLPTMQVYAQGNTPLPTRWADPLKAWQPHSPLPTVAASHSQVQAEVGREKAAAALGQVKGRVAIIVESGIYPAVSASVATYAADLAADSYSSITISLTGSSQYLRNRLSSLYSEPESLVGAVLVGDLPYVIYEMMQDWGQGPEYEDFPCDMYFMDLNGVWADALTDPPVLPNNGKLDTWTGDTDIEIWVSRMQTGNLPSVGTATQLLNQYFSKNHALRWDARSVPPTGLAYNDDDWSNMGEGDANNLSLLFGSGHVTTVADPESTTAADYITNRLTSTHLLVSVRSHGWPQGHGFYRQNKALFDYVFASDYLAIDCQASFFSLFICSGCDYTYPDYLGGAIVFQPRAGGLLAWGSTKTGGMFNEYTLYQRVAAGDSFGEAFKYWFNQVNYLSYAPEWWYGMVLMGDGSCRKPGQVYHVSPSGNDANDGRSWAAAKRTVQAGLNAASAGDQVWVAAGTYVENVTLKPVVGLYGGFGGGETRLSQRNGSLHVTVLDGGQARSVVTAPQGATVHTRIDGFTIRNGRGYLSGSGGGIYCSSSSPTITNNVIMENTAAGSGGGIYCDASSSPVIVGNTITGNSAGTGAGIYCWSSAARIVNNTVTGNEVATAGGGIYCGSASSATIIGNTVTGNRAGINGGGIFCVSSSPIIANNMIYGNTVAAGGYGGGVSCWQESSPTILGNTIAGNSASYGGGICCASSCTIANTIIALNSCGIYRNGGTATIRYSCVYGNTAYNYGGLTDPTGTNGNTSVDPLFASASPGPDSVWGTADDVFGDLRLLPWSPCIDAGRNADVPADAADLDGDGNVTEPLPVDLGGRMRFLNDPQVADTGAGTAPIVDMGAYERCRPVGDVDGDWLTDVVDLLYMVDAFGTYSGDPAYDPRCDFNSDGAVDVVDLLDIVYNFGK